MQKKEIKIDNYIYNKELNKYVISSKPNRIKNLYEFYNILINTIFSVGNSNYKLLNMIKKN